MSQWRRLPPQISLLLLICAVLHADDIPLGVNFGRFKGDAEHIIFVDAFLRAGSLTDGLPPDQLDSNGYPLQIPNPSGINSVDATIYGGSGGHYFGGMYTLLFDGIGRIEITGDGTVVCDNTPSSTNFRRRCEFNVIPTNSGFQVRITRSDINDHVRRIRVILPNYNGIDFEDVYQTEPIHPILSEKLNGAGVIRFLNFIRLNAHPCSNGADITSAACVHAWDTRTLPSYVDQTTNRGVAWEHMLDIANGTNTDPWLTIPIAADDNYVRQLAILCRDRFLSARPQRKVYVELGNEVWASPREDYFNAIGNRTWTAAEPARYRPTSGEMAYVERALEVFGIFEQIFGQTGQRDRIVKVLAGQASSDSTTKRLLHALGHPNSPILRPTTISAFAIAPYFGTSASQIIQEGSISMEELLNRVAVGVNNVRTYTRTQKHLIDIFSRAGVSSTEEVNYSNGYPIELVAYEGGQHLVVDDADRTANGWLVDLFMQANRTTRMRSFYQQMFDSWYQESGNGLFVNFSFVEEFADFGSWGLLEWMQQPVNCPDYSSSQPTLIGSGCKYLAFQELANQLRSGIQPNNSSPASPRNLRLR